MSYILGNMIIFYFVFHISSIPEKMDWVFIYSFCDFSLEGLVEAASDLRGL